MVINTKTISIFYGVLNGLFLALLFFFPKLWVFVPVVILWLVFLILMNYFFKVHYFNIILQFATGSAFFVLLSLLENSFIPSLLLGISIIIFALVWQWSFFYHRNKIDFQFKPLRRFIVIVWAFIIYCLFVGIFSLVIFFPDLLFWPFALLAGIISGAISILTWDLYYPNTVKQNWLWAFVVSLIFAELFLAMRFLPFGPFALALLLVWVWYIIVLLIRFSLDINGINWKKQIWFLLINLVLYILTIYFIRWI